MPRAINPDPQEGETGINIFGYVPSRELALSALVLFALYAVGNSIWAVTLGKRTRVYHSLIVFGCAMEIVGYAFRLRASSNPFLLISFVLQYFMIVVAPVFFTAAIYLSLSVLGTTSTQSHKLDTPHSHLTTLRLPCNVRPSAVLGFFVTADVLTTLLQVIGAALVGVGYSRQADNRTPPLTPQDANKILIAGLAVQTAYFAIFCLGFSVFAVQAWRSAAGRVKAVLGSILCASVLLLTRIVFRLAEAAAGSDSTVSQNQGLFLIEYIPVVVAIAFLTAVPIRQ
ncbi:unnamed protein product [Jaminaea pallidilutea]